ncbi:MAG: hypothetical protein LPK26_04840 [Bacillaceae bacterium]|nr:hypothetical protein [Bacillaceae bacterium]
MNCKVNNPTTTRSYTVGKIYTDVEETKILYQQSPDEQLIFIEDKENELILAVNVDNGEIIANQILDLCNLIKK